MRIVFTPRLFLGAVCASAVACRLARRAFAACLMGTVCIASQARDEAAQIHQWYEKLNASTAAIKTRLSGMSVIPAVPEGRTLEEIRADRYASAEDIAFNVADFTRLHELGGDLAAILRVPAPPGFVNEPVLNLVTLRPEPVAVPPPFGLRYQPIAGDAAALVTHRLLLEDWLRWTSRFPEATRTVEAALDSDLLYASVFQEWAGLRAAARLPIDRPPGSMMAAALLAMPAHAVHAPPAAIVVAAMQNDRIVLGRMTLASQPPNNPSCAASAKRLDARKRHVDANRAFRACHAKALAASPEMTQATQQAQAFLERLHSALDAH